jgi:translation initiation factor 3 subunit C
VKFEFLPEDMKPYIRPPSKAQTAKEKDTKKKPNAAVVKDEEEAVVDIIDDRDLDFSKQENIDTVLNKYKNQQISRRNFDPQFQIGVLHMMLKAQALNRPVKIEIMMLLITTYFFSAKGNKNGFFERNTWIETSGIISELLLDLQSHNIDLKTKKVDVPKEDGADLDTFLSSGDSQILPGIVSFIDKLDQQLFKAFQTLNQTSIEYLQRLRDECILIRLCDQVMDYLAKHDDQQKIAHVGLIKLDHIYFKQDSIYTKTKELLKNKPDQLK